MNYEAIALWSQVIAAVVFAAIVVLAFIRFLTPAIDNATVAKNEEIRENERRRDEAVREVELARTALAEAEKDAANIREAIERDAHREAAIIVATAHSDAQRMIRNARGELERARLSARDKFRVELIELALQEARKQAAARIDANSDAKLVGRFIEELEQRGSTGRG